jgi:hypothetical protein
MRCLRPFLLLSAAFAIAQTVAGAPTGAAEPVFFFGMCDASAAAAVDHERFIVADDEDNILRVYHRNGGQPLAAYDVSAFLGNVGKKKSKEADLEAAAQIGARTFWITSHGRNSKGKEVPERQRLFATETKMRGATVDIEPVGEPYAGLLDELLADARLARYQLAEAATRPPKTPGALNIEGLAATPTNHLLIGFRNPLHDGKALIVPLLNPNEVVEGARAKLGAPLEVDLGGRGIRSIGRDRDRYLIIGGSIGEQGSSQLFEWDGAAPPSPVAHVSFQSFNPEGISFHRADGTTEYFVLSDDGGAQIDGTDCKSLKDPSQKRFRGTTLPLKK